MGHGDLFLLLSGLTSSATRQQVNSEWQDLICNLSVCICSFWFPVSRLSLSEECLLFLGKNHYPVGGSE